MRIAGIWCLLLFAACGGTAGGDGGVPPDGAIRSQEGQACSTDPADDPLLVCTSAQELVCISTYEVMLSDPVETTRPGFVCRYPCATSAGCPQAGDVCCPGPIFGKTFGKAAACVPSRLCLTRPRDGGA